MNLRIGILGCASIADRFVIPAILSNPRFTLKAVASRTQERAETFATKFGCAPTTYENLIDDQEIDAIYLPLPTGLHYEWALKCLKGGKHLLVEKSFTENSEQTRQVVEFARSKGLLLMENFQFQFHSQHRWVTEKISAGEIGEIRSFRSAFGFPMFKPEDNIRYDPSLGGGALLDSGAYTLKATTFILGEGFDVLAASMQMHDEFGVDFFGGGLLANSSGLTSQVTFGFDNFYQCNYEVWGSMGKILVERAFTAGPGVQPKVILEKQNERHEFVLPPDNHFSNLLTHFADCVEQASFEEDYGKITEQSRLIQQFRDAAQQ